MEEANINDLFNKQIYTVDNVLNKEQCKKIIDKANEKGWNESSPSGGGHGRRDGRFAEKTTRVVENDGKISIISKSQISLNTGSSEAGCLFVLCVWGVFLPEQAAL